MAARAFVLLTIITSSLLVVSQTTSFSDLAFQHITNEDFNGVNMDIGWIQFASCKEGCSATDTAFCDNEDHSLIYPNGWTQQQMIDIARYAITVKILPSTDIPGDENTDYAVKADICSNPIYALNNGYELSFTLNISTSLVTGLANLNYWIGSNNAKNRMENTCFGVANGISLGAKPGLITDTDRFYQAVCNSEGLHICIAKFTNIYGFTCKYVWNQFVEHDIIIWIGFDKNKAKICEVLSSKEYALLAITVPTALPTTDSPTIHPSSAPSNTITSSPTNDPSELPSTAPSNMPTSLPTANPSADPSYIEGDPIIAHINTPSVTPIRIFSRSLYTTADVYKSTDTQVRIADNTNLMDLILIILVVLTPIICVIICVLIGLLMKEKMTKKNPEMMHEESGNNMDIDQAASIDNNATSRYIEKEIDTKESVIFHENEKNGRGPMLAMAQMQEIISSNVDDIRNNVMMDDEGDDSDNDVLPHVDQQLFTPTGAGAMVQRAHDNHDGEKVILTENEKHVILSDAIQHDFVVVGDDEVSEQIFTPKGPALNTPAPNMSVASQMVQSQPQEGELGDDRDEDIVDDILMDGQLMTME